MEHDVMWSALAWPGMEQLGLHENIDGMIADSVTLGVLQGTPYRVWYRVQIDATWRVNGVRLHCSPDGNQQADTPIDLSEPSLELRSDGEGNWTDANGNERADLRGCIDIDISITPFTNTLPIHRLGLDRGESRQISVVYIALPEARATVARQRYTCLQSNITGSIYRYEGLDTGFKADISVDPDGLVTDYPRLFTRVWPR